MRTVIIKSTLNGISLGNPMARPGWANKQCLNYAVTEVPDGVRDQDVLRRFDQTATMRGWGKRPDDKSTDADWTYRFDELQPGAILR